jgi:undecaprenyl pyrophosphate synthase
MSIQDWVAVDYSSREAITQAGLGVYLTGESHRSAAAELLGQFLAQSCSGAEDVDLLIRTGGRAAPFRPPVVGGCLRGTDLS